MSLLLISCYWYKICVYNVFELPLLFLIELKNVPYEIYIFLIFKISKICHFKSLFLLRINIFFDYLKALPVVFWTLIYQFNFRETYISFSLRWVTNHFIIWYTMSLKTLRNFQLKNEEYIKFHILISIMDIYLMTEKCLRVYKKDCMWIYVYNFSGSKA